MTQRLPLAFYVNAVAMVLFFIATLITRPSIRTILQWTGGAAVAVAIVLLILKK